MEDKIKKIICNISRGILLKEDINDKTNLIEEYSFDSIMLIQMLTDIENEFAIEFEASKLDLDVVSVFGSLTRLVEDTIE